jgi:hypothetical protein
MQSLQVTDELQVSDDGLRVQASWCESLASKLVANDGPTGAGSAWVRSAAAVNASNTEVAAAGVRCTFRMQATATKLAAAATGYTENEDSSAAQLRAITPAKVC